MIRPEAPESKEPHRGLHEMTITEAWKLANPRARNGARVRI
jgi:hypothetical protein